MKQAFVTTTLLVAVALALCLVPTVNAQGLDGAASPFDLSVTPPTAYLKIRPGNTAIHTITLKNNGTEELAVTPQLVSFSADGVTGKPRLASVSDFPYLDSDSTSFETVKLPAKGSAQLTLHFSVPGSAENREYPLTVLFTAESTQSPSQPSLTPVSGKLGSNIIILISDTESLQNVFSVEEFGTSHVIDSFSSIKFSPVVKNNSYAATVASGSAVLRNWRGNDVAEYEISPSVVLGYASRQIEPLSTPESITDSEGLRMFAYDSAFLVGPYSFSILLPSGDPTNPVYIEHKIIVWAVPFVLLGTIAVTCFALGGYYFYKKRSSIL